MHRRVCVGHANTDDLCKRPTHPCVLASGDPGSMLTCLLTVVTSLHMAKHSNWHSIITYQVALVALCLMSIFVE